MPRIYVRYDFQVYLFRHGFQPVFPLLGRPIRSGSRSAPYHSPARRHARPNRRKRVFPENGVRLPEKILFPGRRNGFSATTGSTRPWLKQRGHHLYGRRFPGQGRLPPCRNAGFHLHCFRFRERSPVCPSIPRSKHRCRQNGAPALPRMDVKTSPAFHGGA